LRLELGSTSVSPRSSTTGTKGCVRYAWCYGAHLTSRRNNGKTSAINTSRQQKKSRQALSKFCALRG
jgi:hypothetical protein